MITTNVHGIVSITISQSPPSCKYVARTIELFDAEGNVVLEVTAFAGDRETMPTVEVKGEPREQS